jgi:hypothetical protein
LYLGTRGYCLELDLREGNHLVCALAAVEMNLLSMVGQHTLHESESPMRKTALRRRIKTVMQERMFKAARIISHTRG